MTDNAGMTLRLRYFTNIWLKNFESHKKNFKKQTQNLKPIKLDKIIRRLCFPNRQSALEMNFEE